MKIYDRLRDLREDMDLNQSQIAKVLDIKQQQYSRYETGENPMKMEFYVKLAQFYNVSLDYITGLIDRPRPLYDKPSRDQVKNQQIIKNSKNFTINNS